jgi:capping protein beta
MADFAAAAEEEPAAPPPKTEEQLAAEKKEAEEKAIIDEKRKDPIACALSIMRRMPPNKIEQNLSALLTLIPEHTDELLQRVDQPLEIAKCGESGREYLLCDYNRDGDSYRSPWSNEYDPPIDDGFVPSPKLRQLEVEANTLFDAYRELYFEGGVSSVYLWDLDTGFAGCFLIKKCVSGHQFVSEGSWDSIHVVEVEEAANGKKATYKLTTTVMLAMDVKKESVGDSNLSGSLTRTAEKASVVDADHSHMANMGSMIEDMETDIRTYMDSLYIQKTREIVNSIRKTDPGPKQSNAFTMNLNSAVLKHGANRKVDSES